MLPKRKRRIWNPPLQNLVKILSLVRGRAMHAPTGLIITFIFDCRGGYHPPVVYKKSFNLNSHIILTKKEIWDIISL